MTLPLVGLLALGYLPIQNLGKDVFSPAEPQSVRIGGRLGKKIDLCVERRLLDQDIDAVVTPYETKTETGSTDWRCEYWGKWFTSLALADAFRSTPATRKKRDEAASALIATAASDGYLGTRQMPHRLEGWDIWGRKYALLGLLADYDRTHSATVLQAARRHTDALIAELGPGKTNTADVGEWNGLPASSVLEPVVLLYQQTGEKKYLDFADHIVASWSKPSKRLPGGMRLVEDALAGKRPVEMCAPKAYEMMSCFEGLCELYRSTGKRDYLQAAVKLAEGVRRDEATIVGVGTSGEIWFDGAGKQTGAVHMPMETCVTVTWMKLCDQLLRLTGDAHYADELEKNLYNGLLGAMMPEGNWWAYFSGMMGVRVPSYVQHADVGLSCCVVNGPRALLLTPAWAFMKSDEGPVVNLYAPSSAKVGDVKLEVKGDYPVSDQTEIRVTPGQTKEFTLSLRTPEWSKKTKIEVNGTAIPITPGYTKIRRTWRSGDRVTIAFDMRGRLAMSEGQVALQRGPVVLSLDNRLTKPTAVLATLDLNPQLKPNPAAARKIGAWMAFDANGLTFCDYASAGNGFSQSNAFRTWLPQPVNLATVYDTGQTWQSLSHSGVWTDPPKPRVKLKDRKLDLALSANGASASSNGEYAKELGCTAELIDGILATPQDFSNRWHSTVDAPHPHWVEIRLAKPSKIGRIIVHFADPRGYPVSFEGSVRIDGKDRRVFRVNGNRKAETYETRIDPVTADSFRLTIYASANAAFPNAAQISEIELYSD